MDQQMDQEMDQLLDSLKICGAFPTWNSNSAKKMENNSG